MVQATAQTAKAARTSAAPGRAPRTRVSTLPFLENGDQLTVPEFMRRYEAMPGIRKAQLIEGNVFMPSPVRADAHAEPDGLIQLWLGLYSIGHPELKVYPNATLILDWENVFQPDAILCSRPVKGGNVWLDEKGYLHGAPEFVCEIAASSASIDLHAKFHAYSRHGVREYFVWLTEEDKLRWFELKDGRYMEKKPKAGRHTSAVFPGLVLDIKALLSAEKAKLAAALNG